MKTWLKVGGTLLLGVLVLGLFAFHSSESVVYKHRHYIYWDPMGLKETVECGSGSINETLMKEVENLDPSKWDLRITTVGDLVIKRFSRSYLSRDEVKRTTITITVVTRNGKLIAFSNVTRTFPGPGAYREVCTTSENGTTTCTKTPVVLDIDSELGDEFTFYYSTGDFPEECRGES